VSDLKPCPTCGGTDLDPIPGCPGEVLCYPCGTSGHIDTWNNRPGEDRARRETWDRAIAELEKAAEPLFGTLAEDTVFHELLCALKAAREEER
jgi:hypothetical protein